MSAASNNNNNNGYYSINDSVGTAPVPSVADTILQGNGYQQPQQQQPIIYQHQIAINTNNDSDKKKDSFYGGYRIPAGDGCCYTMKSFAEAVAPCMCNFVSLPIIKLVYAIVWFFVLFAHLTFITLGIVFAAKGLNSLMEYDSSKHWVIPLVCTAIGITGIMSCVVAVVTARVCVEFFIAKYSSALAQIKLADKKV